MVAILSRPQYVKEMAWHRTGDTLLPEPMITYLWFTDIYIRHLALMS